MQLVEDVKHRIGIGNRNYAMYEDHKKILDDLLKEDYEFNVTKMFAVMDSVKYLSYAASSYYNAHNLVTRSQKEIAIDIRNRSNLTEKSNASELLKRSAEHPAAESSAEAIIRLKKCFNERSKLNSYIGLARDLYNIIADTEKETSAINTTIAAAEQACGMHCDPRFDPNLLHEPDDDHENAFESNLRVIDRLLEILRKDYENTERSANNQSS